MNCSLYRRIRITALVCITLLSSFLVKAGNNAGRLPMPVSNGHGNLASGLFAINLDIPPTVTSVDVPYGRNYKTGEVLQFVVNYTDPVFLSLLEEPYLPITIGSRKVMLPVFAGNGIKVLVYQYTIQPGDQDLDGIELDPSLNIISGTLKDRAGNNASLTLNNVSDTRQILINAEYPSVDLSTSANSVVNAPFEVMAVFSDAMTGLTASDFILTNATAAEPTTTDNYNFFIQITPTADGPVSISLPANAAANVGPTGNTASNQIDLTADLTVPTIIQVEPPANGKYGTTNSLDFTVHFSEDVTVNTRRGRPAIAVTIGGITVAATLAYGSGADWVFSYPIKEGDMDLDGISVGALSLNGGTIRDAGGNNTNLAFPSPIDGSGITVSTTHPTVVLSTTAPAIINNTFYINVDFSEPVTGFDEWSFNLTNMYIYGITTNDNIHYVLEISANINGPAKISLPADMALNAYSTGNTASNELNFTGDYNDPKVTRLAWPVSGTYNIGSVITFTALFNEIVNVDTTHGMPYIAINMTSGTVRTPYTGGSGTTDLTFSYTVKEGDMDLDEITLGAGISLGGGGLIQDIATNYAVLALPTTFANHINVNTTRPSVALSTTAPAILKDPFTVTAVFSELVTGLTASAFTVTNGTAGNLQSADNITYTVTITPTADGPITIALPANVVNNTLWNSNTASNQISVSADLTPPVITRIDLPANGYYHTGDVLTFTAYFSEDLVIDATNGRYFLPIAINVGTVPAYASGPVGTNAIAFTYTVQNGDMAMNGLTFSPALQASGNPIVRDALGNNASRSLPAGIDASGIRINTTHPGVTLSTTAGAIVGGPFTITATFSEIVSGLTESSFTVSNATVTNLQTTDDITYTALVTPTATGAVSITLPANAVLNTGLNGNTAANTINVTADITVPEITQVSVPADGYHNASGALEFTVTFSENVVVNTTGGTPSLPINIGGTTVNATYTGGTGTSVLSFSYAIQNGDADMDGIVPGTDLLLNGGTIRDLSNNIALLPLNNIATTTGVFVNTTHPTVTLSTTAPARLNSIFTVTAVFSEVVTGFTASGLTLVNANAATPQTTDGITYTIDITPMANGVLSVSLPAGAAQNIGLNDNIASNQVSVTADFRAPMVNQVDLPNNGYYNTAKTLNFIIHFDEDVIVDTTGGVPMMALTTEAATMPIYYTGGSGTNTLTFSYTIQDGDMDIDGIYISPAISLGAGATIRDIVGNNANPVFPVIVDASGIFINTAHPDVTLSTGAGMLVNAPFTVTATFTASVTGLADTDFTVTNATASNLQTTDGITYTVLITPTATGAISISLPADAAVNIGLNGNTVSNTITTTADITVPVITQVSVPANGYYKASSTLNFSVQYSENVIVSGTPSLGINIGGTTAQALYTGGSGTQTLSFSYTIQNGDQDMDGITLNASLLTNGATIMDAANNNALLPLDNIAPTTGVFVNTTHPTVALSTTTGATVNAPFTVTATFSEAVTGLSATDFTISNAAVSNLQTTDGITHTMLITPAATGPISLSLPADAAVNIGLNGNTASNTINTTADITAPVITQVTVPANGYYKAASILNFTVQYSKNVIVNGTPSLEVNIGGTTVPALYTGGSGTQTLSFSYTVQNGNQDMDGITLNASLLTNGATIRDAATNNALLALNNIAPTTGVFVNTTHPTVILSTTAGATVNAPFTVTATFSEAVTGLSAIDFTIGNATASNLQTTDDITHTLLITPAATGPISLSLPADAAVNIGLNGNTASNIINTTADITAPVVTQVSVPANGYYKAAATLNFTVKYSKIVTVVGTPSLGTNIGGTTVQALYTSGSGTQTLSFSYIVQNGDQDMDGITLNASLLTNGGTITDAANNNALLALNNIAPTTSVFVNTTHPTVILSTTVGAIVNAPFTVTATFSEAVNGLSATDFTISNAAVSNLQTTDDITHTMLITPAATGAISISLPADAAVNIGLNGNTASNTINTTADITAPVVTQVLVPANGYYKATSILNFTVQYSKIVTVVGTPSLGINIGGTTVQALYTGGSGTQTLSFSYIVQNGDQDMDGITLNASLLTNGAIIIDAANNNALLVLNNIAPTTSVFVNTTHPTVILSTTVGAIVNAPFTVTATFSEAINGLSATDFIISNATVSNLQTTDDITHTLLITPAADGAISVSLPANVVVNIGGNGNTAANTLTNTADITAPVITAGLAFNVNEHSPAGTTAGIATGTEATGTLQQWTIAVDGSGGAFAIDPATGTITVKDVTILDSKVNTTVTLSLTVSDGLNTSTPETVSIRIVPVSLPPANQPPVMDAINNQQVCNVTDAQTLQLTGASAVEAGQTLSFSATADQPYFNTLTVSNTGLITYSLKAGVSGVTNVTVTVKDNGGTANGGVDTLQRTFALTVNSLPVVTIISDKGNAISKGDVINLTATGSNTYSWANADGIISGQQEATLKARPQANITYQVTATNTNGCSSTATITINVTDDFKVDATNILTPNGDGKNDRWVIRNLDSYPDNEVTIYDRTGRMVYHRKNYSNDWEGTINGNPLSEGTYYYILTIQNSSHTARGFITILRDK